MRGIASNPNRNLDQAFLSTEILPELFRPTTATGSLSTVASADVLIAWVIRERERQRVDAQRRSLANTFLLLLVLGALGSTIFLMRDFIRPDVETPMAAYIFRPVLGMFLALALFVVDVFTHAVISEASVIELRQEPLLLLAFGAGLLSDQAYAALETRVQEALRRYRERQGAEGATPPPARAHEPPDSQRASAPRKPRGPQEPTEAGP